MIAALFLLAAFSSVNLIDENVEIPASDWRYVSHAVTPEPGQLHCDFQAERPDAQVRVVLVSHAELEAWSAGREHE